jgi:hypothetical protein
MLRIKTNTGWTRLAAYIILTVAVVVALILEQQTINKVNSDTQQIQRERVARIAANDKTNLILCNQLETIKDKLRKNLQTSFKNTQNEYQILASEGVIPYKLLPELEQQGQAQLKSYLTALAPYNCYNLPNLKLSAVHPQSKVG